MKKINSIKFCKDLYKIHRSISGKGLVKSLEYIQEYIPVKIQNIKSGERVFDWTVPPEWNIKDAYIIDLETNEKIISFNENFLHVLGYSEPVNKKIDFKELKKHIYYSKEVPSGIPYKTSYYQKRWGFCMSYSQYKLLNKKSKYHVVIDSEFNSKGSLHYGELYIKGKSNKELFFSTYICHPNMANNELSGPCIITSLAQSVLKLDNYYSYRFIFVPETIGSISYLSKNLKSLKENVIGGYNVTCVGDERKWGLVPSRYGDNISDKVARHILKNFVNQFTEYSWLDRGSDERQYCSPGVDLPISCITRSKWDEYDEYHTSLDNFELVTKKGLEDSLRIYLKCIQVFELGQNIIPEINVYCEPNLGKRGLHPTIKKDEKDRSYRGIKHFISYCDGSNSILEIAELSKIDFFEAFEYYTILYKQNLFK